jgi:hypothetical protein
MVLARAVDRITIQDKIHCRSDDGEDWIVLRWCHQVDEAAPDEPARWVATGPAVFTLLDSSAVIQISGSALQIVSTGMVLHVVHEVEDAIDTVPVWAGATAGSHAPLGASMN